MTTRFRLQTHSKISKAVIALLPLITALFVTSCASQGVTMHYEAGSNKNGVIEESEAGDDEGIKWVDITLEGGSGKAYIESPAEITEKEGVTYVKLIWNSENYDYVIVYDEKYPNENPGGQ